MTRLQSLDVCHADAEKGLGLGFRAYRVHRVHKVYRAERVYRV